MMSSSPCWTPAQKGRLFFLSARHSSDLCVNQLLYVSSLRIELALITFPFCFFRRSQRKSNNNPSNQSCDHLRKMFKRIVKHDHGKRKYGIKSAVFEITKLRNRSRADKKNRQRADKKSADSEDEHNEKQVDGQ